MAGSARLVNLNSEAEIKLVEVVALTLPQEQQQPFAEECNDLIGHGKAAELIRKLLAQRNGILALPSADNVEGCMGIIYSLLFKLADKSLLPVLAQEICDAVLETVDSKAVLRLRLTTTLYNMLPASSEKLETGQFRVLLSTIKYASEAKLLAMLTGFFSSVDEWVEQMPNLTVVDKRQLYLLIADVLAQAEEHSRSQIYLMQYLASFNGASAGELSTVKAVAARGAIGAIKAPIVSFTQKHNLMGMDAVKQLEADRQYKLIFELLQIFSIDKLEALLAFMDSHPKVFEEHGIDKEVAVSNMRLLSLCSLATEHEEIPYSAVAATLKVGEDEVEDWVLTAIQTGLMDAKMDQLQQVVVIRRCTNRVFGKEQWVSLQAKLHTWRDNVTALLATIKSSNKMSQQVYAAPSLRKDDRRMADRGASRSMAH